MVLEVAVMARAVTVMDPRAAIMVRAEVKMVSAGVVMVHVVAIMALDEVKEDRLLQGFGMLTAGILIKILIITAYELLVSNN